MSGPAVIFDERLRIPTAVHELDEFRRWIHTSELAGGPRIDFLNGDLEVEMSPENLFAHGAPKTAIAAVFEALMADGDRGQVFVDSTRVTHPAAGLSVEPDLVLVLWSSVEEGRVRFVPSAGEDPDQFVELEGAPDLIVEIVSSSSVRKDTQRLPVLYHRAAVRELWLVDARGADLVLKIGAWAPDTYREVEPDADGWRRSDVLGRHVRLTRRQSRAATWRYALELAS